MLVDGAWIGCGSVIGAASLVRGRLPEFCIAFGVPAKVRGWRGHQATGASPHSALGGDADPTDAATRLAAPTPGRSGGGWN